MTIEKQTGHKITLRDLHKILKQGHTPTEAAEIIRASETPETPISDNVKIELSLLIREEEEHRHGAKTVIRTHSRLYTRIRAE